MESREKLAVIKKNQSELIKQYKYTSKVGLFNNQYDLVSDDPLCNISYIFDQNCNAYEISTLLGKGAFGVVKEGYEINSGKRVAIKIQNMTEQIKYHIQTLVDLEITNQYVKNQVAIEDAILKLTGKLIASISHVNHKNEEKHYTVMEYINGPKIKNNYLKLSEKDKYACLLEIAEQLKFLHDNDYAHLDIWSDNILLSDHANLVDYGCAAKLVNGIAISKLKGSHIAPEILKQHTMGLPCVYDKSSDIYALGITFYELQYNSYYDFSLDNTLQSFIERYQKYHESVVFALTEDKINPLADVILKMICDKNDRINISELVTVLKKYEPENNLHRRL